MNYYKLNLFGLFVENLPVLHVELNKRQKWVCSIHFSVYEKLLDNKSIRTYNESGT